MTDDLRFLDIPDGPRIAHRFTPAREGDTSPALVFLPGYMSDMTGGKATALFAWAQAQGRACLLLDYSGCGESSGEFADGSLSRWGVEVFALLEALRLERVVLVGSSMGGWLALLLARALPHRVAGVIGLAAAPDFTEWGLPLMDKALLADGETVYADNPYGPAPTPTHPAFYADAQAQLLLGGAIAYDGPVHLLHGERDEEVPVEIAHQTVAALRASPTRSPLARSDAVHLTLVKDGDHRLSRESDIRLLLDTVAALTAGLAPVPSDAA